MTSGLPFVICNPTSGRGRGAQVLPSLLAALGEVPHALTRGAGDEARLVSEAIAAGCDPLVAVGGDGTWSNVANAVLARDASRTLGLVPAGTGSDLARSLGIPQRDVAAAAAVIRSGAARRIDVGRVERRHFLNIVGFGYDVAVLESSWRVRWLKGELLYLYCAIRQIYSFDGFRVALSQGAGEPAQRTLLMLIVANGRVFGGGFKIAPHARLDDGRLDAVAFRDVGVLRRLGLMQRLLRGTHAGDSAVETSTAPAFRLRFAAPPAYETDGEWNRAESPDVEVGCVPGALRVLAPAGD